MDDDPFPQQNLSPQQQERLRERLPHPDQELIDTIAEYLWEEYDDPVRELDRLAMPNTVH